MLKEVPVILGNINLQILPTLVQGWLIPNAIKRRF